MSGYITENVNLQIHLGNGIIRKYNLNEFNKVTITFGKSTQNDIPIDSPMISDFHGYFQLTDAGWIIFDKRNQNSLIIDNTACKSIKLKNGIHIQLLNVDTGLMSNVSMKIEVTGSTPVQSSNSPKEKRKPAEEKPKSKKGKVAAIIISVVAGVLLLILIAVLLLGVLGIGSVATIIALFTEKKKDIENIPAITETYEYNYEYDYDITTENAEEETEDIGFIPPKLPTDSDCEQFILAECYGTNTTLTLYEKDGNGWVELMSAKGKIGKNGITNYKTEGDGCTPAGEFDLTFFCGTSYTDSDLPYQCVYSDTVWVDDEYSYYYNTLQSANRSDKDWDSAEPMYDSYFKNDMHNYCINIAANGDGLTAGGAIPGNGSVITICGKNTTLDETHGCVDISGANMEKLLGYLDADKDPEIIIY